jgi:hypothetical protein
MGTGFRDEDEDCPLFEVSNQVVKYLFDSDDGPLISEV